MDRYTRREFIKKTVYLVGGTALGGLFASSQIFSKQVPLSGHLWLYASKFPPDWDCTPILDKVFKDFSKAGLEGLEVMESILRHDDVVPRVSKLIEKYELPVTGSSYYGDMWDRSQHQKILKDVKVVLERLNKLGGSTFGITVGDAGRKKTEAELDTQADLLQKIMEICTQHDIQPNLHNHTFEVAYNMHDLTGTLQRMPELKLGPDIGWLMRAGIDPVWFIKEHGDRMVYLHIRDQDANGNWTKTVGEGVADFPAIASALKEAGFDGRAAIELAFEEPPNEPVLEYWTESREYVKNVFGW